MIPRKYANLISAGDFEEVRRRAANDSELMEKLDHIKLMYFFQNGINSAPLVPGSIFEVTLNEARQEQNFWNRVRSSKNAVIKQMIKDLVNEVNNGS